MQTTQQPVQETVKTLPKTVDSRMPPNLILEPLVTRQQADANLASIENFDENLNSDFILQSPRSLQACKSLGIKPIDLAKKSKQQIKEMFFGRDLSEEALVMFEKHLEKRRQEKVQIVRQERFKILQSLQTNSVMSRSRSQRVVNTNQSIGGRSLNIGSQEAVNTSTRRDLEVQSTTNASMQQRQKNLSVEDHPTSSVFVEKPSIRDQLLARMKEAESQNLEKIKRQQKLEILGMVRTELENRKIEIANKRKEFRIRQSLIARQRDLESRRQQFEEAARKREEERQKRAEEEAQQLQEELKEKERIQQERLEKEKVREAQRLAEAAKREEEHRLKQEQARNLIEEQAREHNQRLQEKLDKLRVQEQKFHKIEEQLQQQRIVQAQQREIQHKQKYDQVKEMKDVLLEQQRTLLEKRLEQSEVRRRHYERVKEQLIRKAQEKFEEKTQQIQEQREKLSQKQLERAQVIIENLEEHEKLAKLQGEQRTLYFQRKRRTDEEKEQQIREKKELLDLSALEEKRLRFEKKLESVQHKLDKLQKERVKNIDLHSSIHLLKQVTVEDNLERLAAVNENKHLGLIERLQEQEQRVKQFEEEKMQMMRDIQKFQQKIGQQKDRIKEEFKKRMKVGNISQLRDIVKDFDLEISEDLLHYADIQGDEWLQESSQISKPGKTHQQSTDEPNFVTQAP